MLPYPPEDNNDYPEYMPDDSDQCGLCKENSTSLQSPSFAFTEHSSELFCSGCADFLRRAGF